MAVLLMIFLLMYAANLLIPLCYGDDYLYSFVWEEHQKFFEPLSESARRMENWQDFLGSLWAHYLYHSGRVIIFLPVFFFLWQGNGYFDFANAFIAVVLVMELYWISNRGKVGFDFKPVRLCWIFFALWTFHISFVSVFLWLTGACNYLWSAVLWLGFLIPYTRKWYENEDSGASCSHGVRRSIGMIFFGILAGWTNENTGCGILLLLSLMLFLEMRLGYRVQKWEIAGLLGFMAGYVLLLSAPGNYVRMAEDLSHGLYSMDLMQNFYQHGTVWLTGIVFQIPLWVILWKALETMKYKPALKDRRQDLLFINGFFLISFCTNLVMILVPEFPLRSTFPSLLFLMISVFSAVRLADDSAWCLWKCGWRKTCRFMAAAYFIVTCAFSLYEWRCVYSYNEELIEMVKREAVQSPKDVLEAEGFPFPFWIYAASGFHAVKFELKTDEDHWINAAFARYYGIPGIRVKEAD